MCKFTGFFWYAFSRICPRILYTYGKINSVHIWEYTTWRKPLHFHILCSVQLTLWVNSVTTFCSVALAKFCEWSSKLAALTPSSVFYLAAISNSVPSLVVSRYIYWVSILNLLIFNQIPQYSNWFKVLISHLSKLRDIIWPKVMSMWHIRSNW